MNAKRELLDDVVDEVYRVLLSVTSIDLQRPDPGRVIDCGVLVTTDPATVSRIAIEELDV